MLNPFEYHKPNAEEIRRIEDIRRLYLMTLEDVEAATRPGSVSGRYVALAKTSLEESCMWATKSIVFERDNQEEK